MSKWEAIAAVAITAGVTILLRFLPFLIFRGNRKTPGMIVYLGKVLPYAIMGMLVVYCLRDIGFSSAAGFLPALIASAVVILLHVWRKNTLISIVGGTVCYMILVQVVFV